MTIKDAKVQIKDAVTIYLKQDNFENFIIPIERQRPVFLMGPPGIGKTAIMEQIAGELGVGLLAYSMTHHTRQSALGLPLIVKKSYGGKEYDVSEYTMSEIIASIYDLMEETQVKQGILFLDEMNCVSETLAPAMLQFLQYKTFGRHQIPDGWIVVAAGNPPEYNKSVREFDIVTWDRIKRIDIEPDFNVWKEFAYEQGVHPAVMTYLEIKKTSFYLIETTVNGKEFVTARGWMDLSDIIKMYEGDSLPVDSHLVKQYLQKPDIARSFALYYDLFQKYRADYQVNDILVGKAGNEIKTRAKEARFDERIALLGILMDSITAIIREHLESDASLTKLLKILTELKQPLVGKDVMEAANIISKKASDLRNDVSAGQRSSGISQDERRLIALTAAQLDIILGKLSDSNHKEKKVLAPMPFDICKNYYNQQRKKNKTEATDTQKKLANLFAFCEEVFHESSELTILVTEMTVNSITAKFISTYGCEAYFRLNKELLLFERNREIIQDIELLEQELELKST